MGNSSRCVVTSIVDDDDLFHRARLAQHRADGGVERVLGAERSDHHRHAEFVHDSSFNSARTAATGSAPGSNPTGGSTEHSSAMVV